MTGSVRSGVDVVVCVVTYRRPAPLARLLASLHQLAIPPGATVRVAVVDNDPAGSAGEVAAGAAGSLAISYVVEPKPGIAAARNRAVEAALPCDLIAFLDDDMTVAADWLVRAVACLVAHDADLVNGVVEPAFEGEHSRWVDATLFARQRHPTGTPLSQAATGGLLVRASVRRRLGPLFDEGFGLLGGSDTEMSRRAVRAGMRIVFCREAVAREHTPPHRATARWVLRRAFRLGDTVALGAVRSAEPGPARTCARWRTGLGGLARMAVGVGGVVAAVPRFDPVTLTARCRRLLQGAGRVAGALGWEFDEYGRDRRRVGGAEAAPLP